MLCITSSQAMVRNKDKYQRVIGALIKKERQKRHRLKELGIDYDFPGYVSDIGQVLIHHLCHCYLTIVHVLPCRLYKVEIIYLLCNP